MKKAPIFSPNLNSFRSPRSSEGLTIETLVKLDCLVVFYFSFSLQVEISAALSAPRDEIIRNCFTSFFKAKAANCCGYPKSTFLNASLLPAFFDSQWVQKNHRQLNSDSFQASNL
jgi:hypothetical protein